MDDARLAEIEARVERLVRWNDDLTERYWIPFADEVSSDTHDLIAEVRRLRAECFDLALQVVERMPNDYAEARRAQKHGTQDITKS